jgi:hypothetical protein
VSTAGWSAKWWADGPDACQLIPRSEILREAGVEEAVRHTYDPERRPIGELTVEQAYARYVTRVAPYLGTEGVQELVNDLSTEIGYRYDSPALIGDVLSRILHLSSA